MVIEVGLITVISATAQLVVFFRNNIEALKHCKKRSQELLSTCEIVGDILKQAQRTLEEVAGSELGKHVIDGDTNRLKTIVKQVEATIRATDEVVRNALSRSRAQWLLTGDALRSGMDEMRVKLLEGANSVVQAMQYFVTTVRQRIPAQSSTAIRLHVEEKKIELPQAVPIPTTSLDDEDERSHLELQPPTWLVNWKAFLAEKTVVGEVAELRRITRPFFRDALNDYHDYVRGIETALKVIKPNAVKQDETPTNAKGKAMEQRDRCNMCMIDLEDEILHRISGPIKFHLRQVEEDIKHLPDPGKLNDIAAQFKEYKEVEDRLKAIKALRDNGGDKKVEKDEAVLKLKDEFKTELKNLMALVPVVDALAADMQLYVHSALIEVNMKVLDTISSIASDYAQSHGNHADDEDKALFEKDMLEALETIEFIQSQVQIAAGFVSPSELLDDSDD